MNDLTVKISFRWRHYYDAIVMESFNKAHPKALPRPSLELLKLFYILFQRVCLKVFFFFFFSNDNFIDFHTG